MDIVYTALSRAAFATSSNVAHPVSAMVAYQHIDSAVLVIWF